MARAALDESTSSWGAVTGIFRRVFDWMTRAENNERQLLSYEYLLHEIRGGIVNTDYVDRPISGLTALIEAAQAEGRLEEQLVRQRLGEAYARERVLGLLQERLKAALLEGRMPDVDGSVLKILTAEWGHERAVMANWLQGARGLLAGHDAPAHGIWQDQVLSRGSIAVGGGTLEVHRNGLGERALGLPKEPRFDREIPFKELKTGA